jgi:DNA-binding beta-propeller fold protein YncE
MRLARRAALALPLLLAAAVPARAQLVTPVYLRQWGSLGSAPGKFFDPHGIAVDATGRVYVADEKNDRIQVFSTLGAYLGSWGTSGTGDGQFVAPEGVAIGPDGDVYVTDNNNSRVEVFDASGTFLRKWGVNGTANGQFRDPWGIAVATDGTVFVADRGNARIQAFTSAGGYLRKWLVANSSTFLRMDAAGHLWESDFQNSRVREWTPTGSLLAYVGGAQGSGAGQLLYQDDVVFDAYGRMFIADSGNDRIAVLSPSGDWLGSFGSSGSGPGQFSAPVGLAIDGDGTLYVTEFNNNRVQAFSIQAPVPTRTSSWGRLKALYH